MAIAQEVANATPDGIKQKPIDSEDCGESYSVLGVSIAAANLNRTIGIIDSWLEKRSQARLVTFCTVHMLTEAYKSPNLFEALKETDLKCADGMPLVWLGKFKGRSLDRVAGPDFMPEFCAATADRRYRHFFYGGRPGVAERVIKNLKKRVPSLQVAGWFSPPFRDMHMEEDVEGIRAINESGADIVWICLGCPKQELWMWQHRDRLNAGVLLSVGLAFDIVAGVKKRAPRVMRNSGLEWFYRLLLEPRRLMGRYFSSNLLFFYLLISGKIFAGRSTPPGSNGFIQEIAQR